MSFLPSAVSRHRRRLVGTNIFLTHVLILNRMLCSRYVLSDPDDWGFKDFSGDPRAAFEFLQSNDMGNTSITHQQNRALLFDSALFHQSDPFRLKKGGFALHCS